VLQRTSVNAVDRIDDGRYLRGFDDASGVWTTVVEQPSESVLRIRTSGSAPENALERLATMLGTNADVADWERRTRKFPWLHRLAMRLRGVRPPRYPSIWEALCNAIVFQQISLVAAASIMQRLVVRYSAGIHHGRMTLYPFPPAAAFASAAEDELRSLGLSRQKVAYLRAIARRCDLVGLEVVALRSLPLEEALARLCELPGIGAWSAAVVLLRGCGRLDVFPRGDSGARAAVRALSDGVDVDPDAVAHELGDLRGMLYFHLLLGRLEATRVTS
jgi:DNA-3-methyladenine glycosylase II